MSDATSNAAGPTQELQDNANEAFDVLDDLRAETGEGMPQIDHKQTPLSSVLQRRLRTREDMCKLDFDMKVNQAMIYTNKQRNEMSQNMARASQHCRIHT